jgi:hypothetical protein
MNWREALRSAISEMAYAKDAKAPSRADPDPLLHLLHTGSPESSVANLAAVSALPHRASILWAEWKISMLKRPFQERGTSGQTGRIAAATVLPPANIPENARLNEKI